MRYLFHTLITAAALWVTTLIPGVSIAGSTRAAEIGTLIVVALIFGVVNAIIKPIVHVLGCALYVLTLGLFGLVVNALLFLLTAYIAGKLHLAFHVDGLVPAFFAAIVVSIVSFLLHLILDRFERDLERGPRGERYYDR